MKSGTSVKKKFDGEKLSVTKIIMEDDRKRRYKTFNT